MKTLARETGLPADGLRGPSSNGEFASARESDGADGRPSDDAPAHVTRPKPTQDGFIDSDDSTLRRAASPAISLTAAVAQAAYMKEEMQAILDKRSAKGDELRDAIRIGLSAIGLLQGASLVMAKREREAEAA